MDDLDNLDNSIDSRTGVHRRCGRIVPLHYLHCPRCAYEERAGYRRSFDREVLAAYAAKHPLVRPGTRHPLARRRSRAPVLVFWLLLAGLVLTVYGHVRGWW